MVEPQPSKLMTRVRFPSPAPCMVLRLRQFFNSSQQIVIAHVAQW